MELFNITEDELWNFLGWNFTEFPSMEERREMLELAIDETREALYEDEPSGTFDEVEETPDGRLQYTGRKLEINPARISPFWIHMYLRSKAMKEIAAMSPEEIRKEAAAQIYLRKMKSDNTNNQSNANAF